MLDNYGNVYKQRKDIENISKKYIYSKDNHNLVPNANAIYSENNSPPTSIHPCTTHDVTIQLSITDLILVSQT